MNKHNTIFMKINKIILVMILLLQLIEIVGAVMDRSRMKDMFQNSYGKILNMLSTEVTICKVRKYSYVNYKIHVQL